MKYETAMSTCMWDHHITQTSQRIYATPVCTKQPRIRNTVRWTNIRIHLTIEDGFPLTQKFVSSQELYQNHQKKI